MVDRGTAIVPPQGTQPGGAALRVAVVGDSWIAGLGCKRREAFGRLSAHLLDSEHVMDVSAAGRTVEATLTERAEKLKAFQPDLVIACIGGTEALVHPRAFVQKAIERYAPAHWHGVAGLDPRVRYVTQGRHLTRQRLETRAKVTLKRVLLGTLGGAPRVPLKEFRDSADRLLALLADGGRPVVLVGFPRIDETLFPGTNASVARTNEALQRLAADYESVEFIASPSFREWDDFLEDHLHLNPVGHQKMAELVAAHAMRLVTHALRETGDAPAATAAP